MSPVNTLHSRRYQLTASAAEQHQKSVDAQKIINDYVDVFREWLESGVLRDSD